MNALIALLLAQAVLVTPNKPYAYTINHPLECAYDGQKKIHGRCISPAAVDDEWAPATATTPEHWHCWHPSTEQHAIISRTGHEDQVCCICGKTRCHTGFLPDPCKGHGRFMPGCDEAKLTIEPDYDRVSTSTRCR